MNICSVYAVGCQIERKSNLYKKGYNHLISLLFNGREIEIILYHYYSGVRLIYLQKCNFPLVYRFKLLPTQCAWAKYISQIWRAETFSVKRVHLKTMPDIDINLLQPSYRRSKKLTIFCVAIPLFMSNTLMYLQIAIDMKKAIQNVFSFI